jgi:NodT family efflux transporter outer membrane factor (OMF) lipoprotein
MKVFHILPGLAAVALTGCASVGPHYEGAPSGEHQKTFTGGIDSSPTPNKLDRWWRSLQNPQLNHFTDRALAQNFDLRIAQERLIQSRAERRQIAASFLPQVSTTSGFANRRSSENTAEAQSGIFASIVDQWDLGADVRWEVDVFGGGRRRTESAQASAEATQERVYAARLATLSEIAESYFLVAGFQAQLIIIDENISLQAQTLALVEQRRDAGFSNKLDVQRAHAQLESTRAAKPTLESGLTTQARRLSLLLGMQPAALDDQLAHWHSFPTNLPMVRSGLPAELLTRRPDLRQAERTLAAATADIGVATANFYPRFFLLGQRQQVSANTGNLFGASSFAWQFAPRVDWSLFSSGRNRALLDAANARQREAMLIYEKSVISAIAEVESQLAILQAAHRRLAAIQKAVTASSTAVELAKQLHESGRSNLLDLLVEEQRLNVLSLDQVRSKTALTLAWIRLHQALGGGWQP